MRVLAVDWSGKLKRPEEFLWLAEVHDGELVGLENGRGRAELIGHVVDVAGREAETVAGFDFAFSFPKWWCDERGWSDVRQVWSTIATEGERLLAACQAPLWGRLGKRDPNPPDRRFRRTERDAGESTAKSVFQIGYPGSVGTGSIRGMAHLPSLVEHGFSIWPFDPIGWPRVVEIYPRALTGKVNKSRWADRAAFLYERFPEQPVTMLERAAGSEDAFDAAVSALVMAAHQDQLAALTPAIDPEYAIEGRIWRPE